MQKFILIALILGLAFFLYLLQTGEINPDSFNMDALKGDTEFEIRKNTEDSSVKSSDIYAIIRDKEYKIFSFTGNDFHILFKAEYPLEKNKVPYIAIDAVAGTWVGNRYVFYMLEKIDPNTNKKVYEVYKTEYPTDDLSKLKFFQILSVDESTVDNTFEVKY